MLAVLASDEAFKAFAEVVLGASPTPDDETKLRKDVHVWSNRYHTLIDRAVPKDNPWGVARLDAVGMIFNRLTGLDLGKPEDDYIIKENIQLAAAPVRYPFLWNAPIQDKTQWPGFADNGSDILGLARNLGEVFGVFATLHPVKSSERLFGVDYVKTNSANFEGLDALEHLIRRLGPPKWPWEIDAALAAKGKEIFGRPIAEGGCATGCHEIRPGKERFYKQKTWATPIQRVGTDTKEWEILGWTAKTGVLEGSLKPLSAQRLGASEPASGILEAAVLGSILQKFIPSRISEFLRGLLDFLPFEILQTYDTKSEDLKGAFRVNIRGADEPRDAAAGTGAAENQCTEPGKIGCYESRVMEGIWAAAPYLHNGSVPTLADLLKPADQRPVKFKVGPAYDPDNVGLAAEQTKFDFTLKTTDCTDPKSGNSRPRIRHQAVLGGQAGAARVFEAALRPDLSRDRRPRRQPPVLSPQQQ